MKFETGVRKKGNGHQVWFQIDNQTFFLQPVEGCIEWSSKKRAEWYEKQLRKAFVKGAVIG